MAELTNEKFRTYFKIKSRQLAWRQTETIDHQVLSGRTIRNIVELTTGECFGMLVLYIDDIDQNAGWNFNTYAPFLEAYCAGWYDITVPTLTIR